MRKMKFLLVSCMTFFAGMTISAQTVSILPNWKVGDKANYLYEEKEGADGGAVVERSCNLLLKVTKKDANGYVINATYSNAVEKGSDETTAKLFQLNNGVSFDYKLDAKGNLLGIADTAKAVADIKQLWKKAAQEDKMIALVMAMMGESMSDDLLLTGLMEEVGNIHSLYGAELKAKQPVTQNKAVQTPFGFSVESPCKYTLETVKGNIANVKSESLLKNDDILPKLIDFTLEMTAGMMDGLAAMFQENKDNKEGEKIDMNKIMQEQRGEIEKKVKDSYDINIKSDWNYSFDNSSKWISAITGYTVTSGKADGKDVKKTTTVKVTKK